MDVITIIRQNVFNCLERPIRIAFNDDSWLGRGQNVAHAFQDFAFKTFNIQRYKINWCIRRKDGIDGYYLSINRGKTMTTNPMRI
jgi:hypothetical protein